MLHSAFASVAFDRNVVAGSGTQRPCDYLRRHPTGATDLDGRAGFDNDPLPVATGASERRELAEQWRVAVLVKRSAEGDAGVDAAFPGRRALSG